MSTILWIVFVCLPLLEIGVWLLAAEIMSLISVYAICIITAISGLILLRTESLSLWSLIESEIQNHRMPTTELLDAMLVLICGLLLLFPGLFTDLLGIALLFPPLRPNALDSATRFIRKRYFQQ